MTNELALVARLRERFGSAPEGEVWAGDDAAVLRPPPGRLLLTVDPMVEGVHFRSDLQSGADVGWKALARNVSDVAAMGGRPWRAVASWIVPSPCSWDLDEVAAGLEEAAGALACPVVGGDIATGPALVVTVAVAGVVDGAPVLRSGARPGDAVLVTGPLGRGAADLRDGGGERLRRPWPRVAEGEAARLAGATAMIDLSDGLAIDVRRLADASGVGLALDALPVAEGASWDDAVVGGDDYELLFTAARPESVAAAFEAAGLEPPLEVGRCTADANERLLGDGPLPEGGWEHRW